jgi:NitT/TauT family transport system substrate-binding protein
MSRQKLARFDWTMLKGKELLAFRPGSSPLLFLESAMRKNGVDPLKDVKLLTNVPYPARVGAWLSANYEFAIFDEPAASQLEKDGKAFPIVSIGREVGAADYTAFMATERYIKAQPAAIQSWTNAVAKALKWTESAQTAEVVKVLVEFFPGVDPGLLGAAVERYRGIKIWKSSPLIEPQPMGRFQDILVQGGVLENAKRVKFEHLVATEFAKKAR